MRDLEWYLDLRGTKTGPFAAKDVVEMLRLGKITPETKVTSARLAGEWIKAAELSTAFSELSEKTPSPWSEDFSPPPRPTEQIEVANQTHYVEGENDFDPADSLFQAIRNLRERAKTPGGATKPTNETTSKKNAPASNGYSPQLALIAVLIMMISGALFAITRVLNRSSATPTRAISQINAPDTQAPQPAPPPPAKSATVSRPSSGLLSEGSSTSMKTTPARVDRRAPVVNNKPAAALPRDGGAVYENELPPEVADEIREARENYEQDNESDRGSGGAVRNAKAGRNRPAEKLERLNGVVYDEAAENPDAVREYDGQGGGDSGDNARSDEYRQ